MPRIETELSEDMVEWMRKAWKSNRRLMSEDVLSQLGWTDFATFAGDILRLGFEIASEDPRKFILHTRERKAPIFKETGPENEEPGSRDMDDSLKAYV